MAARYAMAQIEEKLFEDEVRRVARELWPNAANDGAQNIFGRERDGFFVTEDVVHLVEATSSRRKDNIANNVKKTLNAFSGIRGSFPNKVLKGWIITRDEPTADQRSVCDKHKSQLVIMSFAQFRAKLIDSINYLSLRCNYPFGSIRDPRDDTSWQIDRGEFVEVDLKDIESSDSLNVADITNIVLRNNSIIISGDFGAGKSMTLREVFFRLEHDFRRANISQFPIYLNLRDHYGQNDPTEALIRHGTKIGFPQPSQLIRAWRAGYAYLLLDGFDELAAAGWFSTQKKLRDVRYNAMTLIRRFISESPSETAVILAGRSHYFDGPKEMARCLGLSAKFKHLSLNEFTDEQVKIYLKKKGFNDEIPSWLPSRPLLLGYIVGLKIIGDLLALQTPIAPNQGWDDLLELICQREARIEANIDAETLREILERLATKARSNPGGLGRLAGHEIFSVFQEVTGHPPDDVAQMLLMRLPGLGKAAEEDSSRIFIDEDLADSARAGDVFRFIQSPFTFDAQYLCDAHTCIGDVGSAVAAFRCTKSDIKAGQIAIALQQSAQELDDGGILAVDIYKVIQNLEMPYEKRHTEIKNCYILDLVISETMTNMSLISFKNCIIQTLYIEFDVEWVKAPRFFSCDFGAVEGRMRKEDLPVDVFDQACTFETFSRYASTTRDILNLDIPEGVKVLLTILKKLFLQKGRARQQSALMRGLDHRSRRLVPDVLMAIEREGMASRLTSTENLLWKPERSQSARAFAMLSLHISNDPLISKCADID